MVNERLNAGEAGATPPVECAKCTELWSAFWSLSARCSATVDALIGRRDSLHAENQRLREQVGRLVEGLKPFLAVPIHPHDPDRWVPEFNTPNTAAYRALRNVVEGISK